MEWLRSVDLAEYAPNLRGSGVHGGLIVSAHFNSADNILMIIRKMIRMSIIMVALMRVTNMMMMMIIDSGNHNIILVSRYGILPYRREV